MFYLDKTMYTLFQYCLCLHVTYEKNKTTYKLFQLLFKYLTVYVTSL